MRKTFQLHWAVFIFSIAGIAGGYLYWRFIGCQSGTCPITSNWYSSVLMGGIMGYLAGDTLKDFQKKKSAANEGELE
jgi:hypothetical protein